MLGSPLPAELAARTTGYPDRAPWLAARGIGASDVSAILGRGAFDRTAWDVWVRFQPGVDVGEDDLLPSDVRAEGLRFEAYIALEHEAATGQRVDRTPFTVVQHAEFAWATCSPDGFVLDPLTGQIGLWECKTIRDADEGLLALYLDQLLWGLEVTGLPFAVLSGWRPRPFGFPRLEVLRVEADRPAQRRLLLEVARFRRVHILGGAEPALDGSPASIRWHNRNAPSKDRGTLREPIEREAELAATLKWHRTEIEHHADAAKRVEAELAQLFGDHTYGIRLPGAGLTCRRIRSRGAPKVDIELVRRMLPMAILREGSEYHKFAFYPDKRS